MFRNSQGISAQGVLMRLSRNEVVFEVYNPYSIVQMSEVLRDLRIRRNDRDIYHGRAVVTNLVSTGLMLIVSASLVEPWSNLVDVAVGAPLREEVQSFIADWKSNTRCLRPSYRLCVSNIRNFLEELSRWLQHGETVAGITERTTSEDIRRAFVTDVDCVLCSHFDELFGQFEEEVRQVAEDEAAFHKAFAQREIHPLTMCAPFMHRTFTKPLGYAGDYEMVNMILRNAPEGANTYAKVVNSILLRSGTAEAHRNRIARLTEILGAEAQRLLSLDRPLRVLNIGCGPAAEVQRFLQMNWLSDRAELELLDFNQETLEYAQQQITEVVRQYHRHTVIKFTHRSVHELLKQASKRGEAGPGEYDLVYCAGLFDYLNDKICGKLLSLFYGWTAPGGLVVATNVHTRHPVRGFLEHLQDWYLILRDEKQMLALAPTLGQQTASTEATGVNIFLEMRKPTEAM